ncbi:MAG: NADH-quinone oxidoreductase subunit NuoK [Halieaceae bacterium]|jgi:NADH-quinone oxidoreductase subunit K|nr:NADH-quinone oxidoreductase subunit NuoK [Halieaceae bacterium]
MTQAAIPMDQVLLLAGILFSIGLVGVMVRRNILYILLSLEIILNSTGLAFIAAGAHWGQADGQIMFMMLLTLAAAEVSIGLGLILQIHRRYRTLDIDTLRQMRG